MFCKFTAAAAAPRAAPTRVTVARLAFLIILLTIKSWAADQTWLDVNSNNDWSTAVANWNGAVVWTNGNNAIFGGEGEKVEVASDLTIQNITFNSDGYEIADMDAGSLFNLSAGSIITVTNAAQTATISEIINSGDLGKAGVGTLLLSGSNTFSGAVNVTAGILRLANNNALGNTSGATSVSGNSQIELQNGITIAGETIGLGSGGTDYYGGLRAATNATATWGGTINLNTGGRLGSNAGGTLIITGVIQNGTSTGLSISATDGGTAANLGTVRIDTAATYTGTTTVIRGRLQLGITNALPITTTLDLDYSVAVEDSIFDLNGFNQTLGALQRSGGGVGSGGGSIITNSNASASTLTLNQASNTAFSGVIQDGASVVNLIKSGSGTLALTGNNTMGGSITVSGGTLAFSGTNALGAATVNSASLSLNGTNTLSGLLKVNSGGVVTVGGSVAIGGTGGITVASGGRVVLQDGVNVSGKTITVAGSGGNNYGALQTADNITATWSGNIITSADARLGGGVGGTLTINGVISGTGGVLFSRANNATTILNNINTYTGDTSLFANGGTGGRLVMGVDNALNGTSKLVVYPTPAATVSMTVDLNGHVSAFTGLDTSANHTSGNVLFVQNDGSAASTLTLSGTGLGVAEVVFNGRINDGSSGAGGMSLVKNGSFIQTFVAANGFTGVTTLNAGTIQIGKATVSGFTGANGSFASGSFILNAGLLAIDNLGSSNNGSNRIADSASISFRGGSMVYRGSDQTATNSAETLGALISHSRSSLLTVSYGATNTAQVTFNSYSRLANGGLLFVNGDKLGRNSLDTASIARIFFTSAPDLVGTTAALSSGINLAVHNTQIVPGLVGEAVATTGGEGSVTGKPNTFVTYEASGGLRPLNPTDEFTQNAFTSGDNIRITTGTTLSASASINSLLVDGGVASFSTTIGSGKTLTVSSGNILIASGTEMRLGEGGTLEFGSREGIITINTTGNTFITAAITGSAGVSYYGSGTLVTNQLNSYTGDTALYVAKVIPQSSSTGPAGAPTSGPFGKGTLILAGSGIRATTGNAISIGNNVDLRADTEIITSGVAANDKQLTFTGAVSLTHGSRTITNSSGADTLFNGVISGTDADSGITVTGSGVGDIIFNANNTYTGATQLSGNTTLLINGNQSAATGAVNVSAGTLGGTGTVGGATTIQSGGTLSPGAPAVNGGIGTLTFNSGVTLESGSALNLQITGATFTSIDGFGWNEPGTAGYQSYVIAHAGGSGGTLHDQLAITGAFTQITGAKINVLPVSFTAEAGQIFNLIDWSDLLGSSFSGNLGPAIRDGSSDSGFDLDLPDISASGYAWDTSFFATYGIIVVVPEPSRTMLLLVGLLAFGFRRRRTQSRFSATRSFF